MRFVNVKIWFRFLCRTPLGLGALRFFLFLSCLDFVAEGHDDWGAGVSWLFLADLGLVAERHDDWEAGVSGLWFADLGLFA